MQNLQCQLSSYSVAALEGHKWFFAKPRSGLNDVFCQLEKSIAFAEKHGRWVAVEATNSGLLLPISDVFEEVLAEVPIFALEKHPEVLNILNGLSCFPPEVEGALDSYYSGLYSSDVNTGSRPVLDGNYSWREKSRNTNAQVIVHESGGGGFASARFLTRVTLKDTFSRAISRRLSELPPHYLGVHIRNTDVTSDWKRVLDEVEMRRGGLDPGDLPVFLATDSAKVQDAALSRFGLDNLFFGSRLSNRDGNQLHENNSMKSRRERLITLENALFDLMALANSEEFIFGSLRESHAISGFSRLARLLFHRPDVMNRMLGLTLGSPRQNQGKGKSVQVGSPLDIWRENFRVFVADNVTSLTRGSISGKPPG